ncbi:MAG: Holliday junction resolvase RuvX [Anaerolineae bacterium]
MSRILALDIGDERIGLALSDETNKLARPLEVVLRSPGNASFTHILKVIEQNDVQYILVGWPLLQDGSEGKQTRSVEAYLRGLARYTSLPVTRWDERMSTVEANDIMHGNVHSRRAQKLRRDAVAAAVILQQFLNQLAEGQQSA